MDESQGRVRPAVRQPLHRPRPSLTAPLVDRRLEARRREAATLSINALTIRMILELRNRKDNRQK